MKVLVIETSCDETAASVVTNGDDGTPTIASNIVYSQIQSHAPFGGVVPELASREHVNRIVGVVDQAVQEAGGFDQLENLRFGGFSVKILRILHFLKRIY